MPNELTEPPYLDHIPSPMEARVFRLAQQAVENMSHFVEERDNVVMPHKRGPLGRRFRKVRHHGSDREIALAAR